MAATTKRKRTPLILRLLGLAVMLLLAGVILFVLFRYVQTRARQATAPAIRVVQPAVGKPLPGMTEAPVAIYATSASQVTALEWYLNGYLAGRVTGSQKELIGNWQWTPEQEGSHQLSFVAYDDRGTMGIASMEVTVLPAADVDSDGVADTVVACPAAAGPAASGGCALEGDTDQDGLVGEADACPDSPGLAAEMGCPPGTAPDGDADGVADALDSCPKEPGVPDWEGCPLSAWTQNRDGDELPDFMDDCPDAYGSRDTGGCPSVTADDRDGDGTLDTADACPDAAGGPAGSGCAPAADRDGDGIADAVDRCPDAAGSSAEAGCVPADPTADADFDTVLDMYDACPAVAGTFGGIGCPLPDDADGDGIADAEDSCPDLAGSGEVLGCPPLAFPVEAVAAQRQLFIELVDRCSLDPAACRTPEPARPPGGGRGGASIDDDNDGIPNVLDRCPDRWGRPSAYGCPPEGDRDADGVADWADECVDWGGTLPNGCPSSSRRHALRVSFDELATSPPLNSYCYAWTNATGGNIIRIPNRGYLPVFWEPRVMDIVAYETEFVVLWIECFNQPYDVGSHSESLGGLEVRMPYQFWDGQARRFGSSAVGGSMGVKLTITPR